MPHRDAGSQSVFWSWFGAFWAAYSVQELLAIIGLFIGAVSGLVNLWDKCQENKARKNQERRAEELHQRQMQEYSNDGAKNKN